MVTQMKGRYILRNISGVGLRSVVVAVQVGKVVDKMEMKP